MKRIVLFDIDGTILLSGGAGRRAITTALTELVGDAHAFDAVRFDGKTDPQIVVELLAAAGRSAPQADEIEQLCRRYLALLASELRRDGGGSRLMPGVLPLLDRLECHPDVLLGLLTGNMAEGAALKLRAVGVDPCRFRVGAYGSDAPHRPHLPPIAAQRATRLFGRVPASGEVVIIGDTPADMECGAGIGARAVGVATGHYSMPELVAAGAHAVFPDLSDTERVIAALLE